MTSTDDEVWSTEQVRAYLGYGSAAAARIWCRRQGLQPLALRDRSGSLRWDAAAVRAARAGRPGQGARTDLRRARPSTEATDA